MSKFRPLSRLAAACALLLSAVALSVVPAGAGSVAPAGGAPTGSWFTGNGTAIVNYSNFTSAFVYIYPAETACTNTGGVPPIPSYLIGGDYTLAASPATIRVGTNAYSFASPVVAPGSPLPAGSYSFCLYDNAGPSVFNLIADGGTIPIFAPVTGQMVDNGNGSMTLTYSNLDTENGQFLYMLLLTGVTSCPAETDPSTLSGFGFQTDVGLAPSPMTVTVGTLGLPLPAALAVLGPVTAGSYLGCLYFNGPEGGVILQQSLPMLISEPPAPPAFTG